jgi:outer membrane protein
MTPRRAVLMAAVFSLGLASAAHAETLADAVALAYQSNPDLLVQRSLVRSADEAYLRARRGLDPTLSANVAMSLNGTYNTNAGPLCSTVAPVFCIAQPSYTNLESGGLNLVASQTIYSGGRLAATVKSQEASLLAQREVLRQADETLIQSVVGAYTGVLQAGEALEIAKENVDVLVRQREDAQARFDVGTQTRTDVAQAESRLASARSQYISAQNTVDNARAQYRVVIGQSPTSLAAAPSLTNLLPATLAAALDSAREYNPTLRSAYLTERVSAAQVAVAKSINHPNVALGVTAGYTPDALSERNNLGITGLAQVSVPLYNGLTTASTIRSAVESNRQDNIRIETQRRALEQSVTNAWNALGAARAAIQSDTEAVNAAELVAEGNRQQLNVGLSTTLDVLSAEQELRSAQLDLVNAKFTEYTSGVALLNAMGRLEVHSFAPTADLYDPEAHFKQVNKQALPWEGLVNKLDQVGAPAIPQRTPGPDEVVPTFTGL